HVAGAPEYQDWLDRNRSRLRDLAAGAARTLADDLAGLDRPEEALAYARRALDLDPHDEPALRRLVTLLDASGDRAAALRALDVFTRRLAAELDLEPSEETRGLREEVAGRGARGEGRGSRVTGRGGRGTGDGAREESGLAEGAGDGVETSATTVAVLPFAIRGDPALAWL